MRQRMLPGSGFVRALVAVFVTLLVIQAGGSRAWGQIQVAEELFVELSASDPSAGSPVWTNTAPATIGDFFEVGDPFVETVEGVTAVTFNTTDLQDAYQSELDAPEGLVGLDPTRSIEAWVYNPTVADEETIVSWGARGGPDGTNMSFNYGSNPFFGAVGHWGAGFPDLGWNNDGGAPSSGQWHHLVYTYDGETTRVYADGCIVDETTCETNSEFLGAGTVNTFMPSKVTIASQLEAGGVALTGGLRGTLSIAELRVHDGVLTPAQIQNNFDIGCALYCPPPGSCECENCPTGTETLYRGKPEYVRRLRFSAFPAFTGLAVTQPAGATITPQGVLRYTLPVPAPASFTVRVECTNPQGVGVFTWTVVLANPPSPGPIEIAESLIVDLDAGHASAGTLNWLNAGSLSDFFMIGEPFVELLGPESTPGVTFNSLSSDDAYQCHEEAPPGIVGLNPTRSIEVWAYNPVVADEETLLCWGWRGGPDGSNMSFNYGLNGQFGAVGHWGGAGPDLGWGVAPEGGLWHHLVYTFDGDATSTTRVYADGVLANQETLANGLINTHTPMPITLAVQITNGAGGFDFGPREGSLSLGQVRVHDGVLSATQVFQNYLAEREKYGAPEPTGQAPTFLNAPADDTFCAASATYTFSLQADGIPPPTFQVVQPAGATISEVGLLSYSIPQPPPPSFVVEVRAVNPVDTTTASWIVSREDLSPSVQVAETLFVQLDSRDPSAGTEAWFNDGGTLSDFLQVGDPVIRQKGGIPAVSFNEEGRTGDAYQSVEDAPDGLVGPDPTRTIEVWAWNDEIANEETLIAWARRGGGDGTNMSFNYGTNGVFGAVGHWGVPDLGWNTVPVQRTWHHLVYTFDGATARVFDNGVQTNSRDYAPGVINSYNLTKITIAAQIEPDGVLLNQLLQGVLGIGRVRVHDGALSPCQVLSNYLVERNDFAAPPCVSSGDPDFGDTHCTGLEVVETGFPIGQTHTATATGVDDTGDTVYYTFRATDGVNPDVVMGPQTIPTAGFVLRFGGPWSFSVTVDDRLDCTDLASDATCPTGAGGGFRRGDSNASGDLNITDGVFVLNYLFLGGPEPTCQDAADSDDNGQLNITDGVRILNYLFLGGPAPPAPGPDTCGPDPTPEDELPACVYESC